MAALNLKSEALAGAPPSIIPAPVFKHDKPDPSLNWGDFCVHGRDGLLHPVVWDGVLDTRIGERAFVLFQDGSTSLVQIGHLLWTKSKSPIFLPVPSNRGELTDALMMMASRDMSAYSALAKPLIDLVHTTPWAWSNLSDRLILNACVVRSCPRSLTSLHVFGVVVPKTWPRACALPTAAVGLRVPTLTMHIS